MTPVGMVRPSTFARRATMMLVVAGLILGAALVWRRLGTDRQAHGESAETVPEAARSAESSLPSPAVEPPSAERDREAPPSAEVASQPDPEERAVPAVDDLPRGGRTESAPQEMTAPQTDSRPREVEAQISPGVSAPTGGAAPTPPAPAFPRASLDSATRVPDSGAGGPAQSVSSPPTPELVTVRGGAVSPEAHVVPPRESATPPKTEPATPRESPTPEPKTPAEPEPGSDRTPPVLETIRFDPPVVEGGQVTTLTIQARDDLSGLKSVRGEIQSPSGLAVLSIWPQDASGSDTVTFAIAIPRGAETGVWYVKWIYLTDRADNSALIQAPTAASAPPGGTFSVYSEESDSTAPEVLRVWFDKSTIADEDRNVVRVEARDDRSGVASITGACQSPSRSALIWFNCALNEESGIWEGIVPIPANADCGEWVVQRLSAQDKAGNTALLVGDSPVLARAGFQVSSRSDCDSTPPTLEAFDLSPAIVSNGTANEILVTARVSDVGSGAVAMTGWFEGPVSQGGQIPKNYFRCSPDPGAPEAPWTGTIQVPQLAARGTWKVGVIRLEDKAHNFREYTSADPIVSGRVFQVQ